MIALPLDRRHARASGEAARRRPMAGDCRACCREKTRRAGTRGNIGGNVEVGGEIGDDRPRRQIGKPIPKALDRLGEKIRRDIDRRVQARRVKRIDEDFGLDRRAGAVFEQHGAFAAERRHLLGMAAKNRRLGPGQIIFVEARDLLEQFRAALVVEPSAGKRLLSARQAGEHIGAKRFVLAEFRFDEVEHLKRLPRVSAPRTAIARRGGRNCDRSGRMWLAGVAHEPPRNTNCPHMNLPLYSPTAPSAGLKRG